jgi:hypothetical protein
MTTLSKAEQEIHLWKSADEDHWTLDCTDVAALPFFLTLAEKVGGTVTKAQGAIRIRFPQDSIFIGMKRKYNLTPEQRAERAQQMKTRRAGSSTLGQPAYSESNSRSPC